MQKFADFEKNFLGGRKWDGTPAESALGGHRDHRACICRPATRGFASFLSTASSTLKRLPPTVGIASSKCSSWRLCPFMAAPIQPMTARRCMRRAHLAFPVGIYRHELMLFLFWCGREGGWGGGTVLFSRPCGCCCLFTTTQHV